MTDVPNAAAPLAVDVGGAPTSDADELRQTLDRVVALSTATPPDLESALSAIERAEERHGGVPAILELKADVYDRMGRFDAALAALQRLAASLPDGDPKRAVVWERMGDVARGPLAQPQQALIHYQAAFRAARGRKSAIRKAATIYLEQGREEQAKQLLDLESEIVEAENDGPARAELADLYVRVAETLLVKPASHAVAKDAADRALRLRAGDAKAAQLKADLESFPTTWKDHVRRLRDAALDARDKREAAKKYLAIAHVYAAYAQGDPQIEQNVEKCLLLAPGFRPALKFLEGVSRDEGKLPQFVERLKKTAETTRQVDVQVDLWLYVAVLLAERGAAADEVAAAYERVRKADPRNLPALNALTELHLEAGQYTKAAVVMEAFLQEAHDVEAKRNTLRQLARIYEVEIGDLAKAADFLETLRGLGEDDGILSQLADVYGRLNDDAALADVLEALAARAEKRRDAATEARTLERLVALYQGPLALPDKAFGAGRRLFALAPRPALEEELVRLADALARPGELGAAFLDAAARAATAGENRAYRHKAAGLFLQAGDRKRARALLDQLLEQDPRDAVATAALDRLLERDSTPEEHASVLEARLTRQTDPRERAATLSSLADAYVRMRKYDDAIAKLRRVLELDPGHRETLDKLEGVLRSQEQWNDLADVLVKRAAVEADAGDAAAALDAQARLARVYDERLDRGEDAAALYLKLHEQKRDDPEALRALERLQAKGVAVVAIAETLQPYYARVEAWRRHVEMIFFRRDAQEEPARRAVLSRAAAAVLDDKLKSPREAFDAWCAVLQDDPSSSDALAEVERLAESVGAHARLAEVVDAAAERLPDGPQKHALLARRAALLSGVLGDQVAAIEAHKALLASSPGHLPSLDALAEIYASRDAWQELRDVLERRLALSQPQEAPSIAARLGALLVERFGDLAAARAPLEAALAAGKLAAAERVVVLRHLVKICKTALDAGGTHDDAQGLATALADLAEQLAGKERSAVRAELGDVLWAHLSRSRDALVAYEQALANDPRQDQALAGVRQILDDPASTGADRRQAGRMLLKIYDAEGQIAGKAHALGVLVQIEEDAGARRSLVAQLARLLVDDLEAADEAVDLLLQQLERDPDDEGTRQTVETLAPAAGRLAELFAAYARLRAAAARDVAKVYGERLADLTVARGDAAAGIEALQHLARTDPRSTTPWERMIPLYQRANDPAGVADCLARIAGLTDGPSKLERLLDLSDYCFEHLKDAPRGLDALRAARQMAPDDDQILARLEQRLRTHGGLDELCEVTSARAQLATNPGIKAQLLLEAGLLWEKLGAHDDAVQSLTEALRLDRDGKSTARTTDALQRLANRADAAGITALDAIIEHHRAQQAWQPLVESLEIAAQKREPGEPRAVLLDDISRMQEQALRVPQLAFMAACRALTESASDERLARVRMLADATGSWPEFLAVLEDVAEHTATVDAAQAIRLLREAGTIAAQRLDDKETQVRTAEAILRLDPQDQAALGVLEAIHRQEADSASLLEVLQRRAQTANDPATRRQTLLEMGKLHVARTDDAAAEQCFRQLLHEQPEDLDTLALLDELFERTGNSAAHVDVLARRIDLQPDVDARAALRARLALLRLRRRGDPAGALDDLAVAVQEAPRSVDVRRALDVLVEHARARGAPPVGDAARLLETALRAVEDWTSIPAVVELRLLGEADKDARAALLVEVARIQEQALQQPGLAFMTLCRALKEAPDDAALRGEAERLADATDNQESLAVVYEDVVDAVRDPATRAELHRRMARIAEQQGGDPDAARERLVAAVQAGAGDVATLQDLVRLTRQHGSPQELADALGRLARAGIEERAVDVARGAWSELCDVAESAGDVEGAIRAAQSLLQLDPHDAPSRAALERLLVRAERWQEVVHLLAETADAAATPEQQAGVLARLAHAQIERLKDFSSAVLTLAKIAEAVPAAESVVALGARVLVLLAGDSRPEAQHWRAWIASLLEPRYEAAAQWAELAPVLRLRLDVERDPQARKVLWLRIIDVEETLLQRPEQAMLALSRALSEDPTDGALRERAERLAVRLRDLESLIGLYEDLIEQIPEGDPLRFLYANRAGELYEGGVGDPNKASAFYEVALKAAAAIRQPASDAKRAERDALVVLERIERLARAVGDAPRLASALLRRADKLAMQADAAEKTDQIRALLFEAATIQASAQKDFQAAIATLKALLTIAPQDVPALRALADCCERQERWSELCDALERELSVVGGVDPDRALAVRHRLGVVLDTRLNLPDDALAQFQAVLEAAPDHKETRAYLESRLVQRDTLKFDAASYLQASYEKTGDWGKAVEVLQSEVQDLERRGEKKDARAKLVHIADIQERRLNAPEMAFATLCRALKLDPSDEVLQERLQHLAVLSEVVDELAELYTDEGDAAEAQGRSALAAELREAAASLYAGAMNDPARAIATYESILDKQPGRLVPLERLTALYGQVGRFADVEKIVRRRLVFKDEPADRAPLLVILAQVLFEKLDRPEEAAPLLEEVRRFDRGHADARRLLLDLRDAGDELAEARALLDEEIEACKAQGDVAGAQRARLRLALLLADRVGDVAAAIPLWEEIRREQGAGTGAHFAQLERLYTASEDWAKLRKLYEDALEVEKDPSAIASINYKLSDILSTKLASKEEAIERHQKVLAMDPQNQQSLDALRQLFFDLGRWDELVALIRRMMRTQADAFRLKELRFQLAEVLGAELGKRAEAVETGRRILDIEPHTPAQLARLGAIFRGNEAWDELADVVERHAALLEGQDKIARLMELAQLQEEKLARPELAAPAYEQILKIDARHERASLKLEDVYRKNNAWQKLVALKDEQVKKSPTTGERVALLKQMGAIYEEQLGQKPMAFLQACRAFKEDYESRELAHWMDRLALETDSVEDIVEIYDDALGHLADEQRIIETHVRMAELAWKHLASPNDAEVHYKRVLEYDAKNDAALEGLVALYTSLQRHKDVVSIFERRAEQSPDVATKIEWLRRIARTLDKDAGDVDASISAYKRILELDGRDPGALHDLADLLERAERWQHLIGVLARQEEMLESRDERLAVRYRVAGLWEIQLGNPDQAIGVYRDILDEDPAHTLSLKALERLFTTLNRPSDLLKVFERMAELAAETPERVRLLFKIAALHEESLEDKERAVDANERILLIDMGNVQAVRNLERLLRALGQWERLVKAYETHISLTRDPKEITELYLLIGQVYAAELGKTDKAEAVYNAALDFDPGSKEAISALGKLYEKSGNWFNALEKLTSEAQLAGASPEAVELYHRIGKINEDMLLDPPNAIAAYKAALDIEPSHLPSIQALRSLALQRGDHVEYLKQLRDEARATSDEAARTEIHTTTGVFLQEKLGDLESAAEEFEKALAITFDHVAAARPLADICFRDENWSRAENLLDILVERLDPQLDAQELCRQHYRLGYICEKLGKDAKALKNYQRAYEIDATYLPGLEGLGAALKRAGRWEDAGKIYQAILIHHRDGLTDAEVVDYYQQLAELNHKLGQSDRAIKNLEKALELDPNHAPSLRLLGTVHETETRFEEAYEALMRLVPLLSGDERCELLVEIGRLAKSELDDPYRAIDAYEDANKLRPGDRDILEALLALNRQTRQGQRAVEVLEELVRIEPDEKNRVRLNQTLGEVWRDELKNEQRATQYFNAALDLDPTFVKAFESIEALLSTTSNWKGLEENYIAMLKRLPAEMGRIKEVLWKNLGDLYRYRLRDLGGATQAYSVLAKMKPQEVAYLETLGELLAKDPQRIDEAIGTYIRLVPLSPTGPQKALHELVRLYMARRLPDRAYVTCAALKLMGDLQPKENEILAAYQKQAQQAPKRALTDKLWDVLLVHPLARGPLAQVSVLVWRMAGAALARQPKDFGLDKKRFVERVDLDAPVPPYFVTQLKHVRGVLGSGAFEVYKKLGATDSLQLLPLETPTYLLGEGSDLYREMPQRMMHFLIGRQLAYVRGPFVLPRTVGAERFQLIVDAAIRLVDPRYPSRADPKELDAVEKALQRTGGPGLIAQLRAPVAELLKPKKPVVVKPFLEGMEHTAIRAAYIVASDLDLAATLLKAPDPGGLPLAYGAKLKELANFAVSEEHFELRTRLGSAIAS